LKRKRASVFGSAGTGLLGYYAGGGVGEGRMKCKFRGRTRTGVFIFMVRFSSGIKLIDFAVIRGETARPKERSTLLDINDKERKKRKGV